MGAGRANGKGPLREKCGRDYSPGQRQKLRDSKHSFRVETEEVDGFKERIRSKDWSIPFRFLH